MEELRRDAPKQHTRGPSMTVASDRRGVGRHAYRLFLEDRPGRADPNRDRNVHPISDHRSSAFDVGSGRGAAGIFMGGRSTGDRRRQRSHHRRREHVHEEEAGALGGQDRRLA